MNGLQDSRLLTAEYRDQYRSEITVECVRDAGSFTLRLVQNATKLKLNILSAVL